MSPRQFVIVINIHLCRISPPSCLVRLFHFRFSRSAGRHMLPHPPKPDRSCSRNSALSFFKLTLHSFRCRDLLLRQYLSHHGLSEADLPLTTTAATAVRSPMV